MLPPAGKYSPMTRASNGRHANGFLLVQITDLYDNCLINIHNKGAVVAQNLDCPGTSGHPMKNKNNDFALPDNRHADLMGVEEERKIKIRVLLEQQNGSS